MNRPADHTTSRVPEFRNARLDFSSVGSRDWHPRLPEFACAVEAVSLLMPHAEPYVVNSAERVIDGLDPDLRTMTIGYIRQERQHHVQHRRFNRAVIGDRRGLGLLDRAMAAVFAALGRRSAAFGVAFAAGFETIAFAGARWTEPRIGSLFRGAADEPTRLFLWHLAEEVEHKGVAFDVWRTVDGNRFRYAFATIVAALVLAVFSFVGTLCLLWGRRRLFSPLAHGRLLVWSISFVFDAVTAIVLSCLPGHHPDDFADPTYLLDWLGADGDRDSAAISTAPTSVR
ncbi:MAG: metal-dependent hydrolase [Actinomycetota bacterium]